jgi:two-component system sensor histidine kinase TctE
MNGHVTATRSIRRRLIVRLLASAAILAVILFLVVQSFGRQLAQESQDNILAASVTSVLDAITVQDGALIVDIPYSAFSMLGNISDDRVFYRIEQNQVYLTGYEDLPFTTERSTKSQPAFATDHYLGEDIRLVTASRKLSLNNQPSVVRATIAQTRNGQKQTLRQISQTVLFLGIGFFAIAMVLTFYAAQSTIGPLRRLAASVSRRGPQDLRPVESPVPSEMVPLVRSLNQFIGRLKKSLSQSEEFIAEAAHRVRTPLATVRMQAEVTLRRVNRDENREALREMIRAIDESSRAAGQLLDHAMVTFRTDHLLVETFDFRVLVDELVTRLRPIAELKEIDLRWQKGVPLLIKGDAILIQNAVRNLIDNAIKYSPTESSIKLTLSQDRSGAILQLMDQGIGFPDEGFELLTDRFVRGANAHDTIGSGLGLTIADDVANAHGGCLELKNNAEGVGACVIFYLPLR